MEALVARALAQSPTLRVAQATAEASLAQAGGARAPLWPQLNLSGSLAATTNVSNAQTTAQAFSLGSTSLTLRQTLYTFGRLAATIEAADAQAAAARAQAATSAVEVAFAVRQQYLLAAQASGLEAQAHEQLRTAETTAADARARYRSGVAAKLDMTRAETSVAQAKASLAMARAQTAQARRSLAAAIGETVAITGPIAFPPTPMLASRELPMLEAEVPRHPSLLANAQQLAAAEASQRAAEREGYPDFTADASYGYRARDFAGAPNYQAGVSASWPLFTGFQLEKATEAATWRATAAREGLAAVRLAILRDVDNAYLALSGAREAVPAAQAALAAAQANVAQARGRYRAGVGAIVEVADAQALLANAQAELTRARTSYHLAIASLQRALGLTQ